MFQKSSASDGKATKHQSRRKRREPPRHRHCSLPQVLLFHKHKEGTRAASLLFFEFTLAKKFSKHLHRQVSFRSLATLVQCARMLELSRGEFSLAIRTCNENLTGNPIRRSNAERARKSARHLRFGRQTAYHCDRSSVRIRRRHADADSGQGQSANAAFSFLVQLVERHSS